jgi:hypothetical protein
MHERLETPQKKIDPLRHASERVGPHEWNTALETQHPPGSKDTTSHIDQVRIPETDPGRRGRHDDR